MYTLTAKELLKRPIIRKDQSFEYLNKMTDEEIKRFEQEVFNNVRNEKEVGTASMSAYIDFDIIYKLFQNLTPEQLKHFKLKKQ